MSTWSSRGLRGSQLEELLNLTNIRYRELGLALIQKIPTPIKPIRIEQETRHITLAYFDQKSTVDYIGTVQGIPVCFDAKECRTDTFPLQNVHEHQVAFMRDFEKQGGVAFLILYYSSRELYFYQPFSSLYRFWERMENGGRKSFTFDELKDSYEIYPGKNGVFLHYLEALQKDLDRRDG
ncbi:MAG: Holliday junction resolvase RecU [Lachnospiraceae bacterium]|nr:Holliday junction resolvase RecU [Lachnospiraceae bacterium]